MIAFMPESEGNVVGLRASGKLTGADYERVLIPHLESLIERHGAASFACCSSWMSPAAAGT